jgi:signal transduction histidine kinase
MSDDQAVEFLRRLPLFAELPEADLRALCRRAEAMTLAAGEWLMREGEVGETLYVVLEGAIEITKRSGGQEVALALRGAGEVVGEMALLEQMPRSASGRAAQDSRLLRIGQDAFKQVLSASPSAALTLLRTSTMRLQNTEAMLRQQEKMAALGTLAAGLAHELNNPAAAVRRSVAQLRETLAKWQSLTAELDALARQPLQSETILQLREEIARRVASPIRLDLLTRGDRESELLAWLETQGVDEAWELAPALVSSGWSVPELEAIGEAFSAEQLPMVAAWLGVSGTVYALLDEMGVGATRIAEIVKAVKAYTYLDQAPVQEVDVHEGLENTLVILRHKIKAGIHVARDYAADLPRIEAYGSELNQVWTNIIDNAVDAMQGQGELALRTYARKHEVVIEIGDNGPGVPPEVQPRIFEPFYTTKPPGVGTGLGLHITYNVVNRHHGQIRVTSRPGATCFQVTLPVQLTKG